MWSYNPRNKPISWWGNTENKIHKPLRDTLKKLAEYHPEKFGIDTKAFEESPIELNNLIEALKRNLSNFTVSLENSYILLDFNTLANYFDCHKNPQDGTQMTFFFFKNAGRDLKIEKGILGRKRMMMETLQFRLAETIYQRQNQNTKKKSPKELFNSAFFDAILTPIQKTVNAFLQNEISAEDERIKQLACLLEPNSNALSCLLKLAKNHAKYGRHKTNTDDAIDSLKYLSKRLHKKLKEQYPDMRAFMGKDFIENDSPKPQKITFVGDTLTTKETSSGKSKSNDSTKGNSASRSSNSSSEKESEPNPSNWTISNTIYSLWERGAAAIYGNKTKRISPNTN